MSFSASFVLVIVLILVPNLLVVVEARALGRFEHGLLNREILPATDSKYDSISSYKGCAVVLDVERSWSRFNVVCFDHNFDLVLYVDDSRRIYLPFYGKILFGMLRKYQDPKVAYHSLVPMDSYLNYGLLAARAEILRLSDNSGNPCVLNGFDEIVMEELGNRKMSPHLASGKRNYAVIFDAGSSGSRVHVFCFDQNLDLVPIGKDLELFATIEPGLSAFANDPRDAADSIASLLDKALTVVPKELRRKTPVRVGATAGLRALGVEASDRILQAVRHLLKRRSTLKYEADGVSVLDGSQEGSYQWVTINYLLGNLRRKYLDTVGVVDLGGGSVQMAYAISETDAAKAPRMSDGEDTYVKEMLLMGTKYYLYVHSYLRYGLFAARAEILKLSEDSGNPCILAGYDGVYNYGGKEYKASAPPSGSSLDECRSIVLKALKAVEAGFVDGSKSVAKVRPGDFEDAAKRACQTQLEDGKTAYKNVKESNLPYLCMDLVYQFTLLVDGFGKLHIPRLACER